MSFRVTVEAKTKTGEIVSESYLDLIMQACIRRTKRKYSGCTILNTSSRELTRDDKCIPEPPKGWRFAMFACKTKKNRWGREISVPEEMNYEPLNGNDDQKVSIQKAD